MSKQSRLKQKLTKNQLQIYILDFRPHPLSSKALIALIQIPVPTISLQFVKFLPVSLIFPFHDAEREETKKRGNAPLCPPGALSHAHTIFYIGASTFSFPKVEELSRGRK